MATETNCCTFTRGSFYIGEFQDPCGGLVPFGCPPPKVTYRNIGNVISASIQIDYDIIGSENKYHSKYTECARSQVNEVTMSITIGCANSVNIFESLFAENVPTVSGSEIEDFYSFCDGILPECTIFRLGKNGVDANSLVINLIDDNGSIIRPLVEGTEYVFKDRMVQTLIEINEPTAQRLKFIYDYDETGLKIMNALKSENKIKSLLFRGSNYAEGEDALVDVEVFRFRHSPVNDFDVIQDGDFLTLTLQGTVERFYDSSDSESYFRIIKGA